MSTFALLRIPLASPRLRIGLAILFSAVTLPSTALAQGACADHLAEAARVSGLPEPIVGAVLHVESRGRSTAVSSAGAQGCMQIMPRTWDILTARFALGDDAFDPRANMIGGALYLRELIDRYGLPGAYAAYNAGPGRYEDWRAGRRNLPRETVNYLAILSPGSVQSVRSVSAVAAPAPAAFSPASAPTLAPDWKQSTLFAAVDFAPVLQPIAVVPDARPAQPSGPNRPDSRIFVPLTVE